MDDHVLFFGDLVPCDLSTKMAKEGSLVDQDLINMLNNSKYNIVNLEAPATISDNPVVKSGPNIKCESLELLTLLKINIVSLANNHMMDFGPKGLSDTITNCNKEKVKHFGAGKNSSEARKPLELSLGDKSLALFNISENEFGVSSECSPGINGLDIIDSSYNLTDNIPNYDFNIVVFHGGLEYCPYPRPGLKKLFRYFIDLGVDAVICHHSHIASAYEAYKGKHIYYGIGNFIFNSTNKSQDWSEGYGVKVSLNNERLSFNIIPYKQNIDSYGVSLLREAELENFNKKIDYYNRILNDEGKYFSFWNELADKKRNYYITLLYSPILIKPLTIMLKIPFLEKILNNKRRNVLRLNLLRCETHYEIIRIIHEIKLRGL